jgi:hypothetical protein
METEEIGGVSQLFSGAPKQVKEIEEKTAYIPDIEENKPYIDKKLSVAQIKVGRP